MELAWENTEGWYGLVRRRHFFPYHHRLIDGLKVCLSTLL